MTAIAILLQDPQADRGTILAVNSLLLQSTYIGEKSITRKY